jgi:hypothetical protein
MRRGGGETRPEVGKRELGLGLWEVGKVGRREGEEREMEKKIMVRSQSISANVLVDSWPSSKSE